MSINLDVHSAFKCIRIDDILRQVYKELPGIRKDIQLSSITKSILAIVV